MKESEYYRDRLQTYLKHFFLERYLERVGFNICSFKEDFVYVDGFSGPWKSTDETFEDTSFMIAIQKLRKVREAIERSRGRPPKIRCIFIEKEQRAFRDLQRAVEAIGDIDVKPIPGEFEEVVPQVLDSIGKSFSLTFIDPTGWTGFGLQRITPLLQHKPGEVIINFMFDYINRHFGGSFDELFGGTGWDPSMSEAQTVQLYCERVKMAGKFSHVTSTRILKPISDRTYFHLVYATRHWKGVLEFRNVEQKFVYEQERVRTAAKRKRRREKTGQEELFADSEFLMSERSFDLEREKRNRAAKERLRELLKLKRRIPYEELIGSVMEIPLVWRSDLNQMIMELRGHELEVEGLKTRERTPKPGHMIVRK